MWRVKFFCEPGLWSLRFFYYVCVMINAEELRIGVIIDYKDGDGKQFTSSIKAFTNDVHNNPVGIILLDNGHCSFKSLYGTEITEDFITLKTGIKPDVHGQYHFKGYYLRHHHSGVWNVFNATTPHPLTELNFVHEWQNWHHALNKEELKFKL